VIATPELLETRRAYNHVAEVLRGHLRLRPRLTVSEWADRYRVLPETSPEPGPWRTNRVPYLRGIMDEASNPQTREIVFQKAVQIAGSECLNNILGYHIDQDPAPILFVISSAMEAKKYSKERIATMIADSPALAGRVAEAKSRDSDNTIESKVFSGGHLGIVGANAPAGLRSRPRRVVLFDEVDAYPASAGVEGDPVDLAEKRMSNFWNSLSAKFSTPTVEEVSRIAEAMEGVDEVRMYFVPCPHCGKLQLLEWGGRTTGYGIKWESDPKDGRKPHETATYLCRFCACEIDHRHKLKMIRDPKAGGTADWYPVRRDPKDPKRWIRTVGNPFAERIGFQLNSLYSPWVSWSTIVEEFLVAKGNPLRLQVWVNTRLAEVFEDEGSSLDESALQTRASRSTYTTDPLPEKVVLITAGVDVQHDRLEVEILGWGPGEETWSLDFLRIPGDPTTGPIWAMLDKVLRRRYNHPYGLKIPIAATAIDSRDNAQQVLKFTKDRQARNVWPIYGLDGETRPIIGRPTARNKFKVPRYPVGADQAKALVYGRFQIDEPGPGYCHFPNRPDVYDDEYFRQLTAEKQVVKDTKLGRLKRLWVVKRGRRNEALDIRVYATAAYEGLTLAGTRVDQLWEIAQEMKDAATSGGAKQRPESRRRESGGWAGGWR